jgi:tetratricopeptide (TPR) repeat protein
MSIWRPALLLLSVTLAGCAGLQPHDAATPPLIKAPASAGEAVLIARDLAHRGRWSAALAAVESAQRQFPGEQQLDDERHALEQRWVYARRVFEDEILVGDAEAQQRKIELLGRLSRAEPDNLILTSRRLYWKEVLAGKLDALTECAEAHMIATPPLSKRCYELAAVLDGSAATGQRLAAVQAQLRASESEAVERRLARQAKERQARAKVLLAEAKVAIDAHDYRRALDVLAQVEALQPDNAEVSGLKREAWSMISPQIEALIKLGDHLYLDEQLEAAIATWQAALNLKPDDEELRSRIDRAKTVLDRLETLRQRQDRSTDKPTTPP